MGEVIVKPPMLGKARWGARSATNGRCTMEDARTVGDINGGVVLHFSQSIGCVVDSLQGCLQKF